MINRETFFAGSVSNLLRIFIANSSVTTGAGLTGVTSGSGITLYYLRDGQSSTTNVPLSAGTTGTWSSGGFVEVDATHMPGIYEIGVPNAVLATGAAKATMYLQGASNMQETPVFIELPTGDAYAALVTNTYSQPGSVPAATNTLVNVLMWMFTLSRNLITTTATTQTVYADNNTSTISAATVTDDGVTATRGKWT